MGKIKQRYGEKQKCLSLFPLPLKCVCDTLLTVFKICSSTCMYTHSKHIPPPPTHTHTHTFEHIHVHIIIGHTAALICDTD